MDRSTGKLGSGLFYRSWSANDQASAVVLISHGLGEHSGRYEHVAAAFNAAGLHVFALDHLGHGQSPGKRAFVSRFSELTDGVAELRAHIAQEFPSMPVYLVGHSLGGLIAASTVLDAAQDYAGLLMTGPALGVPTPPPAWQVLLLRVFSAVAPGLKALELDANAICRDPAVVEDYVADPLVHHENIPARMVVSLFDEGARVMARAKDISLPVWLLHGAEDQLTSASASTEFVDMLASSDKQCTIYDGMYHELFNEPEQEAILKTCCEWITARIKHSDS
jgi:alpha-beta hydrolase superfamily lysophospholipase